MTTIACDTERAFAQEATTIESASYFRWKYLLGRLLAAILLVPGLPLMVFLLVLVRLTSRGPALFRQTRSGLRGRTFEMLKIRTMVIDAEKRTGPVWSSGVDPRVTPVGRVLRKLHLDELPQLFNVLKGDMALLGPRPERPEIAIKLAESIPGYWRRLAVLPGISGLAQINLPPDTDLESVRRKQVLDLEYIRTASLLLDLRMFACSVLRLLGISGARAMQLFLLYRSPEVPDSWRREDLLQSNLVPLTSTALAGAQRNGVSHHTSETAIDTDDRTVESWPNLRATP